MLTDLHIDFSRGRSGGLLIPSLSEFSTVYCDPHSKDFGMVNKAEIDVFLELSCFFNDPGDIGNLVSGFLHFLKPAWLPMVFFHRTTTNNFTICMEMQKNSNSQSDLEKEECNWRNQPAWLQTILQSYSHQDSVVLSQRQKYRSMEQNRKPRDKSMHLCKSYFWQRSQKYTMEKRQSL